MQNYEKIRITIGCLLGLFHLKELCAYFQDNDENDSLGSSDVWEHPMNDSRLADKGTVYDNTHDSHQFHGRLYKEKGNHHQKSN